MRLLVRHAGPGRGPQPAHRMGPGRRHAAPVPRRAVRRHRVDRVVPLVSRPAGRAGRVLPGAAARGTGADRLRQPADRDDGPSAGRRRGDGRPAGDVADQFADAAAGGRGRVPGDQPAADRAVPRRAHDAARAHRRPPAGLMELAEFPSLMAATYGERDSARGVPATVAWLAEEVGELAKAVRKGSVDDQRHELGDVLAWLASLANQLGLSLDDAVARYIDAAGC